MLFRDFCIALESLSQTTKRLEITAYLAELFHQLTPDEIQHACYLLQGKLGPNYIAAEFQLSTKMVLRALARMVVQRDVLAGGTLAVAQANLFGESGDITQEQLHTQEMERRYKQLGDLGTLAQQVVAATQAERKSASPSRSVSQMFAALQAIAESSGEGSQEQKLSQLVDVLSTVSDQEAKYIIRIVLGKLRLGFSDMTLIDALSWTTLGDKSEHDILEAAYQRRADIGLLATEYLHHADARERARALATIPVQVGVPVMPALCQRLNSTQEMIEKMGEVLAEPKYDGLRVQIHFNRAWSAPHVRTYTRNLEETTHMFPELSQLVGVLRCDQCILDGEAIGYDAATGHLRPFQETITRKRKHDVVEQSTTVPLRFFLFDVLCINEESLIDQPLSERKTRLTHILTDSKTFVQTEHITTSDANELRAFHEQCLAEGLEGMVAKAAAGTYQSGRKGYNWVKIKEEEGKSGKLSDTIDAVVMGYYRGRGKRAGFGIGAFLVGVLADDERIVTIAKIGTGVSDAQWHEMKQRCEALGELSAEAATEQYSIPKALKPDVSVVPGLIVEIAADEITRSPVHSAGVALRFPRLVKFRDDKNVSQATTVAEVEKVGGV